MSIRTLQRTPILSAILGLVIGFILERISAIFITPNIPGIGNPLISTPALGGGFTYGDLGHLIVGGVLIPIGLKTYRMLAWVGLGWLLDWIARRPLNM